MSKPYALINVDSARALAALEKAHKELEAMRADAEEAEKEAQELSAQKKEADSLGRRLSEEWRDWLYEATSLVEYPFFTPHLKAVEREMKIFQLALGPVMLPEGRAFFIAECEDGSMVEAVKKDTKAKREYVASQKDDIEAKLRAMRLKERDSMKAEPKRTARVWFR